MEQNNSQHKLLEDCVNGLLSGLPQLTKGQRCGEDEIRQRASSNFVYIVAMIIPGISIATRAFLSLELFEKRKCALKKRVSRRPTKRVPQLSLLP